MPLTYEEINNIVQIIKRRNFTEEEEAAFTKLYEIYFTQKTNVLVPRILSI